MHSTNHKYHWLSLLHCSLTGQSQHEQWSTLEALSELAYLEVNILILEAFLLRLLHGREHVCVRVRMRKGEENIIATL